MPPIDRVHFEEEQRRNRRRSLRFSVFAIVAVGLAGIPLCVIIAPLVLGGGVLAVHLLDLVVSVPPAVRDRLDAAVHVLPGLWDWVRGRPTAVSWTALGLIYLLPGAILMLLAYPFVLRLTRRTGAGAMLRRLPNRALDPTAFAERQFANVVEEMAVAAGVRPPQVRIIPSPSVNAVAIGLHSDDAVLLATTGFLEQLTREERQAVVAHLVGSVGNGDLEIAAVILSVFQTWGLITLLLETPIHARARQQVRRFLRVASRPERATSGQVRKTLDRLLGGAGYDVDPLIDGIMSIGPRSVSQALFILFIHIPVIATLGLASIAARAAIALFTALVAGPWLAALWRARRRLADATAVQLTRNPGALAGAVQAFARHDVEVPGGWVAYFLFPVWVPISEQSAARQTEAASNVVGMRLEPTPRLARLAALGAQLEAGAFPRPGWRERLRAHAPDPRELGRFVGWGVVAILGVISLLVITLAAASGLLMALWWALGAIRTEE